MDQDQRKDAILEKVQAHQSLELVKLDPELAQTDAEAFKLRAYNWRSEHFRKIWCQRHTTYEPPLNTLNVIMYPKMHFDAPIFLILFVVTERRVMVHFNVEVCLEQVSVPPRELSCVIRPVFSHKSGQTASSSTR